MSMSPLSFFPLPKPAACQFCIPAASAKPAGVFTSGGARICMDCIVRILEADSMKQPSAFEVAEKWRRWWKDEDPIPSIIALLAACALGFALGIVVATVVIGG